MHSDSESDHLSADEADESTQWLPLKRVTVQDGGSDLPAPPTSVHSKGPLQALFGSRPALLSIAVLIIIGFAISWLGPSSQIYLSKLALGKSAVHNRTLGFEKVFAIGFSSRTDKRDALTLASSFTDFDITWSEGVLYEDMPEKAIPEPLANHTFSDSAIGCWRAHLNVLTTIVEKQIQTALIFEDDNDWDVSFKSQLEVFAKGVSALQDPGISPRGSPYGSNWDILWLGHCHAGPRDTGPDGDTQKMYIIKDDPTVPPVPYRKSWWENRHIMPEILANDTRIIFEIGGSLCMWGYAMTFNGARKVLSTLSLQGGEGRQIDGALSNLAGTGYLKGYAVFPPLTGSHRFEGSKLRDSDIKNLDEKKWHEEFSWNVLYSTTMNIPRLVDGATDALSQWPNETKPYRRLDENYVKQVSGELREVDVSSMHQQHISGLNGRGWFDMEAYQRLVLDLSR